MAGRYSGKRVFIPRIPFLSTKYENYPFFFFFKMTQFPIQLNFTMTINKAQGQTLNYVRIYLPTNILSKTTFFSFSFLRKVIDNFM